MRNIFVGNLNSSMTPEAIRSLFEPLGTVRKFKLMTDRVVACRADSLSSK
jgi:RNA recognition motif-containing protein